MLKRCLAHANIRRLFDQYGILQRCLFVALCRAPHLLHESGAASSLHVPTTSRAGPVEWNMECSNVLALRARLLQAIFGPPVNKCPFPRGGFPRLTGTT